MDYQKSRAYIEEAQKYGSVLGLATMREMMKRLGNPQDELRYIHVAGTNGKGSVIACLYSVLQEAGYRVGRYISPTLYSYRERMEVAGRKVSREQFASYITQIARAIEEMTQEGLAHPTPFEIETAAAFLFFKEEKCDLVLLEVGMGGDLDATNLVRTTELAVLVSISLDHQDFLGKTVGEIAQKKAGIIKPGCRVVSTLQKPEAEAVIKKTCGELQAPLVCADYHRAELLREDCFGLSFSYEGEVYEVPLAGVYQLENAVVALEALKALEACGYPVTVKQRREGLRKVRWRGRFTVLCQKPLFVVDGAHNPAAADMLAASITQYFKDRKIYYIMGVFKDKDYRSVIEKTCSFPEKVLTVETPGNPRALPAQELAKELQSFRVDAQAKASIGEAVQEAFALAGEDDVILAFGSLSFIGELTREVERLKPGTEE